MERRKAPFGVVEIFALRYVEGGFTIAQVFNFFPISLRRLFSTFFPQRKLSKEGVWGGEVPILPLPKTPPY
ncbi:MAG: hypothetical protein IJY82_07285 [Oscillospiraceae bacterium]|nr:hypothetical protein [Oscillospiraceae bacterium]